MIFLVFHKYKLIIHQVLIPPWMKHQCALQMLIAFMGLLSH